MSDEDILEALLTPENDLAWKKAIGFMIRDMRLTQSAFAEEVRGKLRVHDRFIFTLGGGLVVVGMIVVLIFLKLVDLHA